MKYGWPESLGQCLSCARRKEGLSYKGRGLCSYCYDAARRLGTLQDYPLLPRHGIHQRLRATAAARAAAAKRGNVARRLVTEVGIPELARLLGCGQEEARDLAAGNVPLTEEQEAVLREREAVIKEASQLAEMDMPRDESLVVSTEPTVSVWAQVTDPESLL